MIKTVVVSALAGAFGGACAVMGAFAFARRLGVGNRLHDLVFQVKHDRWVARRPKRIILVRHGESLGNINKQIYGTMPDNRIPLSPKGEQQAIAAGVRLKSIIGEGSVAFFVSPFMRSRQTFEFISQAFDDEKFFVREDPRLREQEWGNLQDPDAAQKIAEARTHVGRFYYRFETGESGADVYDRATAFMDSLFRHFGESTAENVVIVSHGLFMRFFLMRYFRWSVERFERMDNFHNCEHVLLGLDSNGKFELETPIRFDDTQTTQSLQSRYEPLARVQRQRAVSNTDIPVAPAQSSAPSTHHPHHKHDRQHQQQQEKEQAAEQLTGQPPIAELSSCGKLEDVKSEDALSQT